MNESATSTTSTIPPFETGLSRVHLCFGVVGAIILALPVITIPLSAYLIYRLWTASFRVDETGVSGRGVFGPAWHVPYDMISSVHYDDVREFDTLLIACRMANQRHVLVTRTEKRHFIPVQSLRDGRLFLQQLFAWQVPGMCYFDLPNEGVVIVGLGPFARKRLLVDEDGEVRGPIFASVEAMPLIPQGAVPSLA